MKFIRKKKTCRKHQNIDYQFNCLKCLGFSKWQNYFEHILYKEFNLIMNLEFEP